MINWKQIRKLRDAAIMGAENATEVLKGMWYSPIRSGDLAASHITNANLSYEYGIQRKSSEMIRILLYVQQESVDVKNWTPLNFASEELCFHLSELSHLVKTPIRILTYDLENAQILLKEIQDTGFRLEKKFSFKRQVPQPYTLNPEKDKWEFNYDCQYYQFENGERLIFLKTEDRNEPQKEDRFDFIFFTIDLLSKKYLSSLNSSDKQQFLIKEKQKLVSLEMEYLNTAKPASNNLGCGISILGLVIAVCGVANLLILVLGLIFIFVGTAKAAAVSSGNSERKKKIDRLSQEILQVKNRIIELENT